MNSHNISLNREPNGKNVLRWIVVLKDQCWRRAMEVGYMHFKHSKFPHKSSDYSGLISNNGISYLPKSAFNTFTDLKWQELKEQSVKSILWLFSMNVKLLIIIISNNIWMSTFVGSQYSYDVLCNVSQLTKIQNSLLP